MKTLQFKKMSLALLLTAQLAATPVFAGGIPVFDGAAVAQAIQQGIQLKQQIDNQIDQIKELQKQAQAMTGARDVGSLITNTMDTAGKINNDWQELYGKIKPSSTADLSGKIYSSSNIAEQLIKNQQFNIKALEGAQKRIDEIIKLGRMISQTQDIKQAADLRNRIASEQAYIQAMQVKLDMANRIADTQEKIQLQRYHNRQECLARHVRDGNFAVCR